MALSEEDDIDEEETPPSVYTSLNKVEEDCTSLSDEEAISVTGFQHEQGGAYAWLVIAACTFGQYLGSSYMAFGIFYISLLEQFGASSWETVIAGSLCVGFTFVAGPLASILSNLIGHRITCMVGSCVMALGYVISSFARSLYLLYFSYGLLVGSGGACIVVTTAVMPGFYFEKKRQLVTGIVMAGCGAGGLTFPLIAQYLTEELTWRGAMMILAGLSLQGCVLGALLRPPRRTYASKPAKPRVCDVSLFAHWTFIVFLLLQFIRALHSMMIFTTLPDKVLLLGFTRYQGALLLSVAGICSTIGRVLIGALANTNILHSTVLYCIVTVVPVAVILPLAFDIPYFWVLCCLVALYGAVYGMALTLLAVVAIELFGLERLTSAFGYLIIGDGVGSFVGPALAGVLYDLTGSYAMPFFIASAVALLGGSLSIPLCLKGRNKREHTEIEVVDS